MYAQITALKDSVGTLKDSVSALQVGQNLMAQDLSRMAKDLSRVDQTVGQLVERTESSVIRSLYGTAAAKPIVFRGLNDVAVFLNYQDASALVPHVVVHAPIALKGTFAMFEKATLAARKHLPPGTASFAPLAPDVQALLSTPSLQNAAAAAPFVTAHCEAIARDFRKNLVPASPNSAPPTLEATKDISSIEVQASAIAELGSAILSMHNAASSRTPLPTREINRITGAEGAGLLVVTHLVNSYIQESARGAARASAKATDPSHVHGTRVMQLDGSGRFEKNRHGESQAVGDATLPPRPCVCERVVLPG